jgi:hypothetical protein
MKNDGAKEFAPFSAVNLRGPLAWSREGNVKNAAKLQIVRIPVLLVLTSLVLALLAAGLLIAGCKSAPDLSQAQALTMIQARYDQSPAEPVSITVNDTGMQQGITAKYWLGTKRYPNGYWADFTITPDGKKVLKQASGGDVIQWRPDNPTDPNFVIVIQTVATNHLKARDVGEIQSVGDSRTASFTEDVNLDGIPQPLVDIAHNPDNKLSAMRQATFVLTSGAWTLQSIE